MKAPITTFLSMLLCSSLISQTPMEDIEKMLGSFVNDLNNLRLNEFVSNFTPDATIFYPRNTFPVERVSGIDAITKEFESFFDEIRSTQSGPPYLNINPKDRIISVHNDIAIVTFHFEMGNEFHRRTLILKFSGDKWKIDHIHASLLHVQED